MQLYKQNKQLTFSAARTGSHDSSGNLASIGGHDLLEWWVLVSRLCSGALVHTLQIHRYGGSARSEQRHGPLRLDASAQSQSQSLDGKHLQLRYVMVIFKQWISHTLSIYPKSRQESKSITCALSPGNVKPLQYKGTGFRRYNYVVCELSAVESSTPKSSSALCNGPASPNKVQARYSMV
jgi:hypothetical protein